MSIATEIIDLNVNLAAAKTAVTTAGGTVGDTGLAGLASEIGTIPTGGAFDWGSITYDVNGTSRTATLRSLGDFMSLCGTGSTRTVTAGAATIAIYKVTGVTVGTDVDSIPGNFLGAATALTSFSLPSSIKSIGDNFLSSCTSFNSSITLPSGLTTIGNNFLSICTSFNSSITLPSGLTTIGTYFLSGCASFDKDIILPSGLTTIGNSFLQGCTSFNKDITLPDTITSIGTSFLYNVNSMTSTVYTGNLSPTVAKTGNFSFSTTTSSAPCYTTGISISGTYASDWASRFPDSTVSPYRKLNVV